MEEIFTTYHTIAQVAEAQDTEFIKVITALVFWVGGYAAAPMLFMATMGVFRNLAGMSGGTLKGLRGKLTDKASGTWREDKAVYNEERQHRRNSGALRRKYNFRNRADIRRGDIQRAGRPSGAEWREAETAMVGARLAKGSPEVRKGEAIEAAAKLQASAGEVNAQVDYEREYELIRRQNPTMDTKDARNQALANIREKLTTKLDEGTASQAELTGMMIYLGKQKSTELYSIQEHIAGMEPGDQQAKASNMYHSALGNGEVWAVTQSMSPGLQTVPGERAPGETSADAQQRIITQRRTQARTASPQKLMGLTEPGWKDTFTRPDGSVDEAAMLDAARQLGPEAQKQLNLPDSVRQRL